jgi:hypothetical protein
MKKTILIVLLILILVGISANISHADDSTRISQTPDIFDKGSFHVVRYKSDTPIKALGLVNGKLLVSFSETEHAWSFNNTFAAVNGADPAKALGYSTMQTAKSLLTVPKKSPCEKFKDAVGAIALTDTKTLCLSATPGGDFTLHLLPAVKDKPIPIGFGKQPILEKTKVSWIGYDGNLYIAYLHPSLFADPVTVLKTKTSPTVFLLRNGVRYSIPDEQNYYTWFDSFKSVTITDAKKLASYPLIKKSTFKPNTLIQFDDAPEIYVYQPANDPYLVFGKDTKITEDKPDKWVVIDPKKKTATANLLKRPELLRRALSPSDLVMAFGPAWSAHITKLKAEQKSQFVISEKSFDPTKDILFE